MRGRGREHERVTGGGATTGVGGTPVPVNVIRDRPARLNWVVFLAGPVIWITHFMIVYLAAESGCTGGGHGLELFDPPVPRIFTLVVTVIAAGACVPFAVWGHRWWRARRDGAGAGDPDPGEESVDVDDRATAGFAGLLLCGFSILAILSVGLPAAVLGC
jgi:hypothetical protein